MRAVPQFEPPAADTEECVLPMPGSPITAAEVERLKTATKPAPARRALRGQVDPATTKRRR